MLRKELEENVGNKMNDALTKYQMTEADSDYAGANFKKDENLVSLNESDGIEM